MRKSSPASITVIVSLFLCVSAAMDGPGKRCLLQQRPTPTKSHRCEPATHTVFVLELESSTPGILPARGLGLGLQTNPSRIAFWLWLLGTDTDWMLDRSSFPPHDDTSSLARGSRS